MMMMPLHTGVFNAMSLPPRPQQRQGILLRCAVVVCAPLQETWNIFMDKTRNPARYDTQITGVEVISQTDEFVDRVVTIGGSKTLHEYIAIDQNTHTVIYKMKDDCQFVGYISNTLYEDEDTGIVTMEFLVNWTAKSTTSPVVNVEQAKKILRDSLHLTKALAENEFLKQPTSFQIPLMQLLR